MLSANWAKNSQFELHHKINIKKNEVFLTDLVMELDCRGWLSEVSDIHSANLKSWEVFEVVLGILPPISTNYLLILTKARQVLCELSWGEKKAKKMRKERQQRAQPTIALDDARRCYLSIFPSQGEQRAEVKAFSGWTKCSLLTPDWIWRELKTTKQCSSSWGGYTPAGGLRL